MRLPVIATVVVLSCLISVSSSADVRISDGFVPAEEDIKVLGATRIPLGNTRVRRFAEATDATPYVVTYGAEGHVLRLDPAEE